MPPLPAPKWRRRAEARPEEILEAALLEFTEKGFKAARMEDIAKRAGISKAGIYLYFDAKETLLKALIEAKVAPLADMGRALAQSGAANPKAAFELISRAAIAKLTDAKNIAVPRLVFSISARFPEIAEHYRARVIEVGRQAFIALFKAGREQGVFRDIDPDAVVSAFIGPMFFEAVWTHIFRGESRFHDPEKIVRTHIDILFNGIVIKEPSA